MASYKEFMRISNKALGILGVGQCITTQTPFYVVRTNKVYPDRLFPLGGGSYGTLEDANEYALISHEHHPYDKKGTFETTVSLCTAQYNTTDENKFADYTILETISTLTFTV